jgi:cytochrome c553
MNLRLLITVCSFTGVCATPYAAFAISPFKKAFDEQYVKASGDEEFQAAFRKGGCYVCHAKDKKKDVVNHYGNELAKLIPGVLQDRLNAAREGGKDVKAAEEEKALKELADAMKKVETMKSPSGVTYGELFESHQLPAPEGEFSTK